MLVGAKEEGGVVSRTRGSYVELLLGEFCHMCIWELLGSLGLEGPWESRNGGC